MEVRVLGPEAPGVPYLVQVGGDIDIATVAELEGPVIGAIQEGCRPVVLDLADCAFIDSSGIRLILRAHRLLRVGAEGDGHSLGVVAVGHVAKMLQLTGVDKVIPVCGSHAEAEEAVSAP